MIRKAGWSAGQREDNVSVPGALGTGDLEPCTLPTLLQIRAVCTASIHVTVSFPTSQAGSEISCEMCDSGTPVPFGLQRPEYCKLCIWRETKKPVGAPWRNALSSAPPPPQSPRRLGSPWGL